MKFTTFEDGQNRKSLLMSLLFSNQSEKLIKEALEIIENYRDNVCELVGFDKKNMIHFVKNNVDMTIYREKVLPYLKRYSAHLWQKNQLALFFNEKYQRVLLKKLESHQNPFEKNKITEIVFSILKGKTFQVYHSVDLVTILEVYLPFLKDVFKSLYRYKKWFSFLIEKEELRRYTKWMESFEQYVFEVEDAISWTLLLRIEAGSIMKDTYYDDGLVYAAKSLEEIGFASGKLPDYQRRDLTPEIYAKVLYFLSSRSDNSLKNRFDRFLSSMTVKAPNQSEIKSNGNFISCDSRGKVCFLAKEKKFYFVPLFLKSKVPSLKFFPKKIFKFRHLRVRFISELSQTIAQLMHELPDIEKINFKKNDYLSIDHHPAIVAFYQRRIEIHKGLEKLSMFMAKLGGSKGGTYKFFKSYEKFLIETLDQNRILEFKLLLKARKSYEESLFSEKMDLNFCDQVVGDVIKMIFSIKELEATQKLLNAKEIFEKESSGLAVVKKEIYELVEILSEESNLSESLLSEKNLEKEIFYQALQLNKSEEFFCDFNFKIKKIVEYFSSENFLYDKNKLRYDLDDVLLSMSYFLNCSFLSDYFSGGDKKSWIDAGYSFEKNVFVLKELNLKQSEFVSVLLEKIYPLVLSGYFPENGFKCFLSWKENSQGFSASEKNSLMLILSKSIGFLEKSIENLESEKSKNNDDISCMDEKYKLIVSLWGALRDHFKGNAYCYAINISPEIAIYLRDPAYKKITVEPMRPVVFGIMNFIYKVYQCHNERVDAWRVFEKKLMFIESGLHESEAFSSGNEAVKSAAHDYFYKTKKEISERPVDNLKNIMIGSDDRVNRKDMASPVDCLSVVDESCAPLFEEWHKKRLKPKLSFFNYLYPLESKGTKKFLMRDEMSLNRLLDANHFLPKMLENLSFLSDQKDKITLYLDEILRLCSIVQSFGSSEDKFFLDYLIQKLQWHYLQRWIFWDRQSPSLYALHKNSFCQEKILLSLLGGKKQDLLKVHIKRRKSILSLNEIQKDWIEPCILYCDEIFIECKKIFVSAIEMAIENCFSLIKKKTGCFGDKIFRQVCDRMRKEDIFSITDARLNLDKIESAFFTLDGDGKCLDQTAFQAMKFSAKLVQLKEEVNSYQGVDLLFFDKIAEKLKEIKCQFKSVEQKYFFCSKYTIFGKVIQKEENFKETITPHENIYRK